MDLDAVSVVSKQRVGVHGVHGQGQKVSICLLPQEEVWRPVVTAVNITHFKCDREVKFLGKPTLDWV